MTTRLLTILFLLVGQTVYSQIGDTTNFDPDTKQKMVMICDSLKGDWLLTYKLTIGKEKNDTINQKVSDKSNSRTATTRPKIILSFKSNGDIVITEFPNGRKASVTKAKWKVEVRPFDDIDLFFVEIYNSDNKNVTNEFNGFITDFDINRFQLSDKSWRVATKQWTELNFIRQ